MKTKNIIYIQASYRKFIRNISQTRWDCRKCMGKRYLEDGSLCPHCEGTTKYYRPSVEDYICLPIQEAFQAEKIIFHAAGKEDVDVRCLGSGRPFVVEVINPQIYNSNLDWVTNKINASAEQQIEISLLHPASKDDVVRFKETAGTNTKKYQAFIELKEPITLAHFDQIKGRVERFFSHRLISQRIPTRIIERKGDRERAKLIHSISLLFINETKLFIEIVCQGGTYIKEFISGDLGRTNPSLTAAIGQELRCIELDLVDIHE
jgi:tRNA pseudouridine synthase 10